MVTSRHSSVGISQTHIYIYIVYIHTHAHSPDKVASGVRQMDKLATGNNTLPEEHSVFCTFKVILQYFVGLGVIFNCFIVVQLALHVFSRNFGH